jgi:hypothetical protein
VEGISLFRLGAPGEPLGFPARSLAAAARPSAGRGFSLQVERLGSRVAVRVTNEGVDALCDVQVGVETRGGSIRADGPIAWRAGTVPASPSRADRAALTRPVLLPGETWEACDVAADPEWVGAALRCRSGNNAWWTLWDEDDSR